MYNVVNKVQGTIKQKEKNKQAKYSCHTNYTLYTVFHDVLSTIYYLFFNVTYCTAYST